MAALKAQQTVGLKVVLMACQTASYLGALKVQHWVELKVVPMAFQLAGQWVCGKLKHHLVKLSYLGMPYIHLRPPHYLPKLM